MLDIGYLLPAQMSYRDTPSVFHLSTTEETDAGHQISQEILS